MEQHVYIRQVAKEIREAVASLKEMAEKQARKFRVLIVENDPRDEELCMEEWKKFDNHVEMDVAHSGQEAIEKLKHNAYDLMLLDLKPNGFSGLDVLRECLALALKVKTIVLTGTYQGNSVEADKACELGAICVMRKPITTEQVASLLIRT